MVICFYAFELQGNVQRLMVTVKGYAFVLEPLAEIAPNRHHPIKDVCYQKLWQDFDKDAIQQEKVDYSLTITTSDL
jgi:2-amino-4-hydroxy-6-hydroxymethyldihydropteridine diphosphokinase